MPLGQSRTEICGPWKRLVLSSTRLVSVVPSPLRLFWNAVVVYVECVRSLQLHFWLLFFVPVSQLWALFQLQESMGGFFEDSKQTNGTLGQKPHRRFNDTKMRFKNQWFIAAYHQTNHRHENKRLECKPIKWTKKQNWIVYYKSRSNTTNNLNKHEDNISVNFKQIRCLISSCTILHPFLKSNRTRPFPSKLD